MRIIHTIDDQYIEIVDEVIFNRFKEKHDKYIIENVPDEAKPSGKDLEFIRYIDSKIKHLEDRVTKNDGPLRIVRVFNNWSCISQKPIIEDCLEDFRHMYIEYDVDLDYDVSALLLVDLDNQRIYVQLQQSGIALPYAYEDTDDVDTAIQYLEDYIENPEEYADYK